MKTVTTKRNRTSKALLLSLATCLVMAGCSSSSMDTSLSDNSGSRLTTTAGQAITESMLLGKWDVDGERTNNANKDGGTTAIPDDIMKDVLGAGWKFEPAGVLKIDATPGYKTGSYTVSGSTLTVKDSNGVQSTYQASFKDGYLYLKDSDGRYKVFEKAKFFNF